MEEIETNLGFILSFVYVIWFSCSYPYFYKSSLQIFNLYDYLIQFHA